MARPKVRGEVSALNIKIDKKIADKLSKTSSVSGIPKTRIVEDALKEYFKKK